MIIQLIYRELSCKEMYNVWSVTCWSALTGSDKFDLYLSERCRMWEQERRGGGGDIRRTASKEWAGQEVRPGITLAAGRVRSSPLPRHVSTLSGRCLPSVFSSLWPNSRLLWPSSWLLAGKAWLVSPHSALSALLLTTKTTHFYYDGLYRLVRPDKERVCSFYGNILK